MVIVKKNSIWKIEFLKSDSFNKGNDDENISQNALLKMILESQGHMKLFFTNSFTINGGILTGGFSQWSESLICFLFVRFERLSYSWIGDKIRFLNTKATNLGWYHSRPYQELKFLIRDLLLSFVNPAPTWTLQQGLGWGHIQSHTTSHEIYSYTIRYGYSRFSFKSHWTQL